MNTDKHGCSRISYREFFDFCKSSIDYGSSNPLDDGIVQISSRRGSSLLRIDPDGLGTARARPLLLVENVAIDDLNNVNNFVF